MMRSMYSAVSGLKTHQTKMDVIGNNVANVNTVAFKSSSVTFQEIMYQTISTASGANAATGLGGTNAKQIGLGVSTGSTTISITSAGASQTTGNPFDIKLTDANSTNFFVVNNGSENLFTRAGSFYVDGSGNLCMSSTGYTLMGWQVDETTGDIRKDTVSALQIMSSKNLTSAPEATSTGYVAGVIDKNSTTVTSDNGYTMSLNFYDDLGYSYTAKFAVKTTEADAKNGTYSVELTSILDSENNDILANYVANGGSIKDIFGTDNTRSATHSLQSGYTYDSATPGYVYNGNTYTAAGTTPETYTYTDTSVTPATTSTITLGDIYGLSTAELTALADTTSGYTTTVATDGSTFTVTKPTEDYTLQFNTSKGTFQSINGGTDPVSLNLAATLGGNFSNISVDFSACTNYDNSGTSTMAATAGTSATDTTGKGKALGALTGITVDTSGKIYGTYDNGNTVLLAQIAAAQFANASGLEKVGENCYTTTLNSGEFDGIGVEISADGSKMTTGELEMSNVDLSTEFTDMITTQRGFQANSRVITTSDTLLEELVNLKR